MESEIDKLLNKDKKHNGSDILLTLNSKLTLQEAKVINMYKNWKKIEF